MTSRWIELEGRVEAISTVEAPLTGAPCVLYQVQLGLIQRFIEGFGGPSSEIAGRPFMVRWQGQPLMVDTRAARIKLRRPVSRKILLGRDPAADRRLARLYRTLRREVPGRSIRCRERQLTDGDRIWLGGDLDLVPGALGRDQGYRFPPRTPVMRARYLSQL